MKTLLLTLLLLSTPVLGDTFRADRIPSMSYKGYVFKITHEGYESARHIHVVIGGKTMRRIIVNTNNVVNIDMTWVGKPIVFLLVDSKGKTVAEFKYNV